MFNITYMDRKTNVWVRERTIVIDDMNGNVRKMSQCVGGLLTSLSCLCHRTRSINNECSSEWHVMVCYHGITQGHLGICDDLATPAYWRGVWKFKRSKAILSEIIYISRLLDYDWMATPDAGRRCKESTITHQYTTSVLLTVQILHQHMSDYVVTDHICISEVSRAGALQEVSLVVPVPVDDAHDVLHAVIDVPVHAERVTPLRHVGVVRLQHQRITPH